MHLAIYYCATPKVAHSVSMWRSFSVEYNIAFKTLTQIGENANSSMRHLMNSEQFKSVIISSLQPIRNLTHQKFGFGSKAIDGTVRVYRHHHKVPPHVGSLVFHNILPNMPYMVTGIWKMSSYQFLTTISNGVWTYKISWPQTLILYLQN